MPLVPFKLLPWLCWSSEWVCLRKFGVDTLRGTARKSSSFFFLTNSNPIGFYSQKLWGLIFLALQPWVGVPSMGLAPPSSQDIPPKFLSTTRVWGPAQSRVPVSPTFRDGCGFFSSIVGGLPFNSISDGSEWLLVCNLVVILMWWCQEVSHVYLCLYLDRKLLKHFIYLFLERRERKERERERNINWLPLAFPPPGT